MKMMWDTNVKGNRTFPEVRLRRKRRRRDRLVLWDWLLSPCLRFRFPSQGRIPQTGAPMSV